MTHKYHAKPTEIDGIRFASKKEGRRYQELKLLEMAGEIENLELHPSFKIEVNGEKVCRYIADFRYREKGREIVEDAKGVRTPVYILKRKLMKAVHGIEIKEI